MQCVDFLKLARALFDLVTNEQCQVCAKTLGEQTGQIIAKAAEK